MDKRHIIAAVALALLVAHLFRYEVFMTESQGGLAYRLDRWTGAISAVTYAEETAIKDKR